MDVPLWVWWLTIGVTVAVFVVDVLVVGRRPHEPSRRELTLALSTFIGAALLFGLGVWYFAGGGYAKEFYAGWLTEYSLSVDNLFIFIIIMSRFGVPRQLQQKALLIGIVLALVFRATFIAVGAAAIAQFSWVFYFFGAFLVYTGFKLALQGPEDEDEYTENRIVRWARTVLPHTEEGDWGGGKVWLRRNGVFLFTPMFAVIVALGTTDLLFALDSIPAIFGLTQEPYLVLTANVFALMGLRQLYFLIGALLERLVYLSYGLALLLGFIGVKLVLHAMHENEIGWINGGEHITWAPEISIEVSLGTIVTILVATTVLSLWRSARYTPEELDEHTGPRHGAPHQHAHQETGRGRPES